MPAADRYLAKAKEIFEELIGKDDECLSRAEIIGMVGESDYALIRNALVATEKVEAAAGRAGGLIVKRAQGNRREWGASAETKARRFLLDQELPDSDEPALQALRAIYEQWPQGRIAEALSVSQGTVSNCLRDEHMPPAYADALVRLRNDLKGQKAETPTRSQLGAEETPYADWLRAELERQKINAVNLAQRSGVHVNTILGLLEGRTEKPQQRTRQRIETALQIAPAPGVVESPQQRPTEEDPWYYIGLPWTDDEIDQVPDEPGVYIIHDRLGRPAYVGVAHTGAGGVRARLKDHNKLRWTADRRVASSFSYALAGRMPRADPSQLAKALEKLLIKFMGNAILINEKDVTDLMQ